MRILANIQNNNIKVPSSGLTIVRLVNWEIMTKIINNFSRHWPSKNYFAVLHNKSDLPPLLILIITYFFYFMHLLLKF